MLIDDSLIVSDSSFKEYSWVSFSCSVVVVPWHTLLHQHLRYLLSQKLAEHIKSEQWTTPWARIFQAWYGIIRNQRLLLSDFSNVFITKRIVLRICKEVKTLRKICTQLCNSSYCIDFYRAISAKAKDKGYRGIAKGFNGSAPLASFFDWYFHD